MKNSWLAVSLLLVSLTACESAGPSELDSAIRSLLRGPLALGDVDSFVGESASSISAPGGSEGAEYLFVVSHISTNGEANVAVSVRLDGGGGAVADLQDRQPGLLEGLPGASPLDHRLEMDDGGFHQWHRERERRLAEEMVGHLPQGGRALLLEVAQAQQLVPDVGDIIQINVSAFEPCGDPDLRDARVEAVSAEAIVLADVRNPVGLTQADFQRIAQDFDQKVVPLASTNFGAPAREIGPDRTTILYTVAVNQLASGFGGVVGGFFFARDLFPRTAANGLQGCPASNEREMFYMLAPDPDGAFGQPVSADFVRNRTLATVMHEHQHLINASRRLYILGAGAFEVVWLNEALSHIAEELLFYQESGLTPGRNLSLEDLRASQQRLDAANSFQLQNLERYSRYLLKPSQNTPINPADGLETRGASWSFLRYVTDQHVDDDRAFFFSLVNTTETGITNLQHRLGRNLSGPLYQWDISNYADDFVPGLSGIYHQPSWNFRSLLPALAVGGSFPLQAESIPSGQSLSWTIRGGSAAFMRFSVPAGGQGLLTTSAGGGPPPSSVRGTLVRLR